jgi:uncharacterized protein
LEKLICGDRQLSALDVQLSEIYTKTLSSTADKQKLKSDQIAWIKETRSCTDVACVQQALQQRITQLSTNN